MPAKTAPDVEVLDEASLLASPTEGFILDMLPPDLKAAILAARARLGVTDISAEIRASQIFVRRGGDEIAADLSEADAIEYLTLLS